MTAFVIYYNHKSYEQGEFKKTIDGLIDSVSFDDISTILICADGETHFDDECLSDINKKPYKKYNIKVIEGASIGRAKLFNLALSDLDDLAHSVVFLDGPIKFGGSWFNRLKKHFINGVLCSCQINTLDRLHWSFDKTSWNTFGFRWDLDLICKKSVGVGDVVESAVVSSYCMAGCVETFKTLGGFDDGMLPGCGEDIEISIRNWLMGGRCLVVGGGKGVAVAPRLESNNDVHNKARIAELWMGKKSSYFYDAVGLDKNDLNVGRLNQFNNIGPLSRSINWLIESKLPEIGKIFDLAKWCGKSVGIISNGYSIDLIDQSVINRHDILIGVDFMATKYECDFVVTNDVSVVEAVSKLYKQNEVFMPVRITDVNNGQYIKYDQVMPQANVFETSNNIMAESLSVVPPFIDYNDNTLFAVQISLFMNPREIIIYGMDNKIINGKSHTSNIEYYRDGVIYADNAITRKHFANIEYGLSRLGLIASKKGVSLLRMSHL